MPTIASHCCVRGGLARVHEDLEKLVNGVSAALPLTELGFDVRFFGVQHADSLNDNGHPVFLPATSEMQAESVSVLRRNGFWYSPVVAIVHDYVGHQTYSAIRNGASSVINMAIGVEEQIGMFRAVTAFGNALPDDAGERSADDDARASAPQRSGVDPQPSRKAITKSEADALQEMLYGDETVSAIARRFFCSERTMYRKIRSLYDHLQVSGRSELRSRMALRQQAS